MPDPLFLLLVASVAGVAVGVFFWPQSGVFWQWRHASRRTERVLAEDALKQIYEARMIGRVSTRHELRATLSISDHELSALLAGMKERDLLESGVDSLALTPDGVKYALHVIRAHRLWERYLAEKTGYEAREWHDRAHEREHHLSPADLDTLVAELDHPTHDPHGDPIPTPDGQFGSQNLKLLTDLAVGDRGSIVHLEDEPVVIYDQLVADGLAPGMTIDLLEVVPQHVRFLADGDEHALPPSLAANISVAQVAMAGSFRHPERLERLSTLKPGQEATVTGIAPTCRGAERRRFLDLGILPGTHIEAALASPSGNPIAYRIRGALIALRQEQAHHIQISIPDEV